MSIREALRDDRGSFLPDRLGKRVTLTGVLTSDPVLVGAAGSVANLQDHTAAILLFTNDTNLLVGHYHRGDFVEVSGKIGQYKGQAQLVLEEILRLGARPVPAPRDVLAADLQSKRYQGQLVRVVGELIVPRDLLDKNRGLVLRDRSGEIPVYVYPRLFNNPKFTERLMQGGGVELVGVAGQSKEEPPFDSGYRLVPRGPDDFHFAVLPPYRAVALSVSLVVLCGLTLYFWLRRQSAERRARAMAVLSENLKRSEQALRLSEERFAKAFRSSPDAIALSTVTDGVYIDVNDSFLRLSGYEREEVIGHTALELSLWVDPKERDALAEGLWEQGTVSNIEAHFRMKSGEVRVGLVSSEVIDLGGNPCMLTVMRDITRRKEAERKLEERTAYLNALIENSPLAIVAHDSQDRVQMCNPAFERLFLYRQAELVGAQLDDLIKPAENPSEAAEITRRVLSGETVHVVTRRRRKDGTQVEVELHAVPLTVQGVTIGAYGLYQDITARKELEEQLRQAQKMEAVGRLAGGVAHDFNNLLMVIRGHAEMLAEQVDADDPPHRNVSQIQKAAERAGALTQQLLAYSRKQVVEPKVLDLNVIVAEMCRMLPRLLGEDIELTAAQSVSLGRVRADRGQIEQVLLNLAVNARDAMPQGGKLTLETANVDLGEAYARRHAGVRAGPYVMLAVSDTGTGMDEETLSHVFEPFFTTKDVGKGTGLGLATVFGVVQQSDGHIWVHSEPGKGTTFRVYLPRIEGAVEETGAEKPLSGSLEGTETILLVEDEEAVRDLVRDGLQRRGYTVLEARNGAEALAISTHQRGPIHLLVTDVVMPGMSGREVAHRLAPLHPKMKVLYISGYIENAVVHHGVLDPGTAFLQKPFREPELAQKVRELLDGDARQLAAAKRGVDRPAAVTPFVN